MFGFYHRFFGTSDLNPTARKLVFSGLNIAMLSSFVFSLANTFFALYALQFLSPAELGIVVSVQFLVQGITDYPTGAIGDWLGQKWLLAFSNLLFGLCYIAISLSSSFLPFLIIYAVIGFANGQNSGAFMSWFDNNYKVVAPEDGERKTYVNLFAKFQMVNLFLSATAFFTGGMMGVLFGRSAVIFVQGAAIVVLFVPIMAFCINDHPNIEHPKPDFRTYGGLLVEGITTTWNNKTLRNVIFGFTIMVSAGAIWGQLMLFPFYESYAKTDDMTGLLRSVIFLLGAIVTGLAGTLAKKISDHQRALAWMSVLGVPMFYGSIFLVTVFIPPAEKFLIMPYLGVIVVFGSMSLGNALFNLMYQRFNLEIIPDRNRNSVYSLVPTLMMFGSIIATLVGGQILAATDISTTLLLITVVCIAGGLVMAKAVLNHGKDIESEQLGVTGEENIQPAKGDVVTG